MRRLFLLLVCSLFVLGLTACGETYDEEEFDEVQNYAEEISDTTDTALFKLSNITEDDFDQDEDYWEETDEMIEEVGTVNDKYWEDEQLDSITKSSMQNWSIKMTSGEDESWKIKGEDLADAVYDMKEDSDALIDQYEKTKKEGKGNLDQLSSAYDDADESTDELKHLIFNK